jgi:hypothetical protein
MHALKVIVEDAMSTTPPGQAALTALSGSLESIAVGRSYELIQ